jgi:hypothetical protein
MTTYKTQKPVTADITDNRPFYMVVRLGSGGYQKEDSLPTTRYDDVNEARTEAERLATKHPNHPRGFAVVKAISIVKAEVSLLGFNLEDENISPNPFLNYQSRTIPCHQ